MTSAFHYPGDRSDQRTAAASKLGAAAAWLSRAPRDALLMLVRAYRLLVSPWRPPSCRFEPSCSAYALDALGRHGAAAGSCLAVHRVLRCGPWCRGGFDPVPPQPPRLFRFLAGDLSASPDSTPTSPP